MARKKTPLKDLPHISDELSLTAILSKPVLLETLTRRTANGRSDFWACRYWECTMHLCRRFAGNVAFAGGPHTARDRIIHHVKVGNLRILDFKRLTKRTTEQCVTCGEHARARRATIAREKAQREACRADH